MTEHYGLHVPLLQRGLHANGWKYVIQSDGFEELYELSADPCEMNNLASSATRYHAPYPACRDDRSRGHGREAGPYQERSFSGHVKAAFGRVAPLYQ